MKRLSIIILAVFSIFCSCTQHDGNIGHLFGTWVMESRTLNGQEVPFDGRGITFRFQNKILLTQILYADPFESDSNYGNFKHEGDELILTYMVYHEDDPSFNPINQGYNHQPPTWLGFPYTDQPIVLKFLTLTGKKMTLEYVTDTGDVYIYKLAKV